MPDSTGPHTTMTFVYTQFSGDWNRFNGVSAILYHANANSEVRIVAESRTGIKTTYFFRVPQGKEVWVCYDEVPLAHIPALCYKRVEGDGTECSKG